MLKAAKADNITLCLWTLIKDIIDEGGLEKLDIIQELEESQEESLPERTSAKEDPPHSKLQKRRDRADELIIEKVAHPKKRTAESHGEGWAPTVPSAPPMTLMEGDEIQRDMQLQKLEFEIKLQKLTNELQELKRVSNTRENNNSETRQSPLERVISQEKGRIRQKS